MCSFRFGLAICEMTSWKAAACATVAFLEASTQRASLSARSWAAAVAAEASDMDIVAAAMSDAQMGRHLKSESKSSVGEESRLRRFFGRSGDVRRRNAPEIQQLYPNFVKSPCLDISFLTENFMFIC